jgi:hypothetical protein
MKKDFDIRDQVGIKEKGSLAAIELGSAPKVAANNKFLSSMNNDTLEALLKRQMQSLESFRTRFDLLFDLSASNLALLKPVDIQPAKENMVGWQLFYAANSLVETLNRIQASMLLTKRELERRRRKK